MKTESTCGDGFESHSHVGVKELYDEDDDRKMDGDYIPDNDDTYDDESDVEYITDDEVEHNAPHDPQDALNIAGVHSENENENADIKVEEDTYNDNAPGGNNDNNNDDGNNSSESEASEEDPDNC